MAIYDIKLEVGKSYWNNDGEKFTIIHKNEDGLYVDNYFQKYKEDGSALPDRYWEYSLTREVIEIEVGKTYRSVGFVKHGEDCNIDIVDFKEFEGYIDQDGAFYTKEGVYIRHPNSEYSRANCISNLNIHSEIIVI